MAKPLLGAQLYTIREFTKTKEDLIESFKKVADIGYTTVQLSGIGVKLPAEEMGELLNNAGLHGCCTHYPWERFLNDIDNVIAEHQAFNCKHAAIGGLDQKKYMFDPNGINILKAELEPVAAKLAEAGMDFSYHNHNWEFMRNGDNVWLTDLYDQIDSSVLKAEFDVYWVTAGGGDPVAWMKKYSDRLPLLHLKDMTINKDREQNFCPIGEGNLNWELILKTAEEANVEFMLVEQDNCYGADPFECLATSYNNVSAMGYK
jgi:sugar phosphate isomerase/epimerase